MPNPIDTILPEMKMIQLQLYLAKKSIKKQNYSRTLLKVESHIDHSLISLHHLITQIDDFKTTAELQHFASHRIKDTQ